MKCQSQYRSLHFKCQELRINVAVQGHTIAPQVARDGSLLLLPAGVGLLAAASAARPPGEELSRLPKTLLAVLDAVLRGVEYDFPLRVGVQTLVVTVALDLVLNVLLSVAGSSWRKGQVISTAFWNFVSTGNTEKS